MTYYLVLILGTLSVYTDEKAACGDFTERNRIAQSLHDKYPNMYPTVRRAEIWQLDIMPSKCLDSLGGKELVTCAFPSSFRQITKGSCRPKEEFFFEGEGK